MKRLFPFLILLPLLCLLSCGSGETKSQDTPTPPSTETPEKTYTVDNPPPEVFVEPDNKDFYGRYEWESEDGACKATLEVTKEEAHNFKFFLSAYAAGNTDPAATKDIEGTARFGTTTAAKYRGEDKCAIRFEIGEGEIALVEVGCVAEGEGDCTFSGTYSRMSAD